MNAHNRHGSGDGVVGFALEIDDVLVRTSPKEEAGVPEGLDERSVHKDVKIREEHAQFPVCKYLLIGEAGPAPDGLVRFRLYPSCQLGKPST